MASVIEIDQAVLEMAAKKAIEVLIDKYDSLGMRASGEWANQLEYVIEGNNKVVIRGMDYTEQLVQGRGPSSQMPPVDAIYQWMLNKSSFTGEKTRSMAWAISKKIQKEGTKYYQDGGTDLLEVLDDPALVDEFYKIIGDFLRITIAEQLTRDIKQALQ